MLSLCLNYIICNMNKIIDFMRLCLGNQQIPQSWGISDIKVSKDNISFNVNGSKYQGAIQISERESMISVMISNDTRSFSSAEELLVWLDETIE